MGKWVGFQSGVWTGEILPWEERPDFCGMLGWHPHPPHLHAEAVEQPLMFAQPEADLLME